MTPPLFLQSTDAEKGVLKLERAEGEEDDTGAFSGDFKTGESA